MTCGPRSSTSSPSPILTSQPGQRATDGADAVLVGVVDRRARGVLGHAVALEDHDAGGVEPLGDLPVEGGGAGDEEAHASTEALAHLAEHQLVEEAVLQLEQERDRLALALELLDLEADRERLVEDLLLGAALGRLHRLDAAVGLLEDAGRRTHEGRLHRRRSCRRSSRPGRRPRTRSRTPAGPRAGPCRTSGPSAATGTAGRSRRGCSGRAIASPS